MQFNGIKQMKESVEEGEDRRCRREDKRDEICTVNHQQFNFIYVKSSVVLLLANVNRHPNQMKWQTANGETVEIEHTPVQWENTNS